MTARPDPPLDLLKGLILTAGLKYTQLHAVLQGQDEEDLDLRFRIHSLLPRIQLPSIHVSFHAGAKAVRRLLSRVFFHWISILACHKPIANSDLQVIPPFMYFACTSLCTHFCAETTKEPAGNGWRRSTNTSCSCVSGNRCPMELCKSPPVYLEQLTCVHFAEIANASAAPLNRDPMIKPGE